MAAKTFATYLGELSAVTSLGAGDKIPVLESSTVKYVEGNGLGVPTYARYVALLTQTDTDAPVATVLENTLGGTVVWSYNDVGEYSGTLTGAFTAGKTGLFLGNTNAAYWYAYVISVNAIGVQTFDSSGSTSNEVLIDTMIEIRVYP